MNPTPSRIQKQFLRSPYKIGVEMNSKLSVHDHSRDILGYTYVYPVISRRAGGVSVGINLNPNNACNWACIYCQVPGLTRGNAPTIDLQQLEQELRDFLGKILRGDWLAENVPEGSGTLQDIAFSGNGEPTSAHEFADALKLVARVLEDDALLGKIKVRLITNGSLMLQNNVLEAISILEAMDGEVWFKIDRATPDGILEVNAIHGDAGSAQRRLLACAARCPTWIQTCWFCVDGQPPSESEQTAYLRLVDAVKGAIKGVHLYSLARQPMQPGASKLSSMPAEALQQFGKKIEQLGVAVSVSP